MKTVVRSAALAGALFLGAAISPAKAAPWTFTKAEPVSQARPIASPAQGFSALVFEAQSSGTEGSNLTRMAFRIDGALKAGNLSNFQLLYFPDGIANPGIVLGRNDGATWAPGGKTTVIEIACAQPLAVSANFKGQFVLRADLQGGPAFFTSQLLTVTVASAGVERSITETEDLPLRGDTFTVK